MPSPRRTLAHAVSRADACGPFCAADPGLLAAADTGPEQVSTPCGKRSGCQVSTLCGTRARISAQAIELHLVRLKAGEFGVEEGGRALEERGRLTDFKFRGGVRQDTSTASCGSHAGN